MSTTIKENQLEHRLKCIEKDVQRLVEFINDNELYEIFQRNAKYADMGWSLISNIEIACELDNTDSLEWKA